MKKNKMENKMSVITATKSFPFPKAQASDSISFVSSCAVDITFCPTFANQADLKIWPLLNIIPLQGYQIFFLGKSPFSQVNTLLILSFFPAISIIIKSL